jgi:hypothetical protein
MPARREYQRVDLPAPLWPARTKATGRGPRVWSRSFSSVGGRGSRLARAKLSVDQAADDLGAVGRFANDLGRVLRVGVVGEDPAALGPWKTTERSMPGLLSARAAFFSSTVVLSSGRTTGRGALPVLIKVMPRPSVATGRPWTSCAVGAFACDGFFSCHRWMIAQNGR